MHKSTISPKQNKQKRMRNLHPTTFLEWLLRGRIILWMAKEQVSCCTFSDFLLFHHFQLLYAMFPFESNRIQYSELFSPLFLHWYRRFVPIGVSYHPIDEVYLSQIVIIRYGDSIFLPTKLQAKKWDYKHQSYWNHRMTITCIHQNNQYNY